MNYSIRWDGIAITVVLHNLNVMPVVSHNVYSEIWGVHWNVLDTVRNVEHPLFVAITGQFQSIRKEAKHG